MRAGVVLERGRMAEQDRAPHPATVPANVADEPLLTTDVAVVEAGAAGLYAALTAARDGAGVALVSATPLAQTASYWAQGGIAAALAVEDDADQHLRDTEAAGRTPCATRRRGRSSTRLRGASPTSSASACASTPTARRPRARPRGGHSRRRVVHAGGSATGRRIVRQLSALAVESPRIAVLEGARATSAWLRTAAASGSCSRTAARSAPAPRSSRRAARLRCGRARPTRPARWDRDGPRARRRRRPRRP